MIWIHNSSTVHSQETAGKSHDLFESHEAFELVYDFLSFHHIYKENIDNIQRSKRLTSTFSFFQDV